MPNGSRGFSLVELMMVIVIIAILASVAVPGYRDYVQRAQRVDATAALLRIAAAQEKFYLQNNTYTANLGAPPAGIGIPNTDHGYYNLAVTAATAANFTVQAIPVPGSGQAGDSDCQLFTMDEQGNRGSSPNPPADCWR